MLIGSAFSQFADLLVVNLIHVRLVSLFPNVLNLCWNKLDMVDVKGSEEVIVEIQFNIIIDYRGSKNVQKLCTALKQFKTNLCQK